MSIIPSEPGRRRRASIRLPDEADGRPRRLEPMPDHDLALNLVRTTEAAALGAARWVGRGDKNAADQGGRRRHAAVLQRRADGRRGRHRRGGEGRGADALQRRAHRHGQPAGGGRRRRPDRRHAPGGAGPGRMRCRSSPSPAAARCSTRARASTWRRSSPAAKPAAAIDITAPIEDNIRNVATRQADGGPAT